MNSRWSRLASVERGKLKKGPWTFEEDIRLLRYIRLHGDGRWSALAKAAGLQRCGKSCRLRWVNYLRPDLKRGKITEEEERVIIDMHARWGNRWSLIAERLPGRTDNEIKNYWRSHLKKKLQCAENTNDLKSCLRSCSRSISDSSKISGQAASTQPTVKHSLYSTVTTSSPSSSSGENSVNHYYPAGAVTKLNIPPTASCMSQEFKINTNIDINSIISEDDAMKIKGHHDIHEQGHATQLSLTSSTSCNYPEIRCAQNDGAIAGMDPPFYSYQSLERDALCAIPYQFYSGIPSELDYIAATGLQMSTPNSGDAAVINPVLDHHADYEMESSLDLGSDMILWNMCPIPSTQSELLQLPFGSPNLTSVHEQ